MKRPRILLRGLGRCSITSSLHGRDDRAVTLRVTIGRIAALVVTREEHDRTRLLAVPPDLLVSADGIFVLDDDLRHRELVGLPGLVAYDDGVTLLSVLEGEEHVGLGVTVELAPIRHMTTDDRLQC